MGEKSYIINHNSYIINPSNYRIVYAYQIIQGLDGFMMYDLRCKIYDFSPAQTPHRFSVKPITNIIIITAGAKAIALC